MSFVAPAWLPGGHLQTIYAATLAPLFAVGVSLGGNVGRRGVSSGSSRRLNVR